MHFERLTYNVLEQKPTWNVIDVGGAAQPFKRANAVIDLRPWDARDLNNCTVKEVPEHYTKDDWYEIDLMEDKVWPFKAKEFDMAVCTHTLEDLAFPQVTVRELNRIGKNFYIEIPSRFAEQALGLETHTYTGYSHHQWVVVPGFSPEGKPKLTFYKKDYDVMMEYPLHCPNYHTINKNHAGVGVYIASEFEYEFITDMEVVRKFYAETLVLAASLTDLWHAGAPVPEVTWADPFAKPMTYVGEL
ncbi:MAG: hypothetical protein WC761_00560 [Candidatus Paceibacterota bacterium]|jgi:hypothetical protein